jgi:hypothetical protein
MRTTFAVTAGLLLSVSTAYAAAVYEQTTRWPLGIDLLLVNWLDAAGTEYAEWLSAD